MPTVGRLAALRSGAGQSFISLTHRGFRRLFVAELASGTGNAVQLVAQTWLLLTLGAGPTQLGELAACQYGPVLLLTATAGAAGDRYPKLPILLATRVASLVVGVSLAVATMAHSVRPWHILVAALLIGCSNAVYFPIRQTLVFDAVGPELVGSAIGLTELTINATRVVGTGLAGIAIGWLGTGTCFLLSGVSNLPVAVVLLLTHRRIAPQVTLRKAQLPGGGRQLRNGLVIVARTPVLRALILLAVAAAMVFNFSVAPALLAEQTFSAGARGYSLILALFGVGALVGATVGAAGRIPPPTDRLRILGLLTVLSVLATAAAPTFPLELAAMAVTGAAAIWFVTVANTLLTVTTPPAVRGSVIGLWSVALAGSVAVTGPVVAQVAAWAGPRVAQGSAAAAILLTLVVCWRFLAASRADTDPGREAPPFLDAGRPGRART